MPRLAILAILSAALASGAETIITFAPQGSITSRVSTWVASACPPKAVPITVIYSLATHRGIPWISPKTASELFAKKSAWSRAIKITGFASAGAAAVTGTKVVEARPQITYGLAFFAGLTTILMPLAEKEVPKVDPSVGLDLMIGANGCGSTSFYTGPSNVIGFNEVLP